MHIASAILSLHVLYVQHGIEQLKGWGGACAPVLPGPMPMDMISVPHFPCSSISTCITVNANRQRYRKKEVQKQNSAERTQIHNSRSIPHLGHTHTQKHLRKKAY